MTRQPRGRRWGPWESGTSKITSHSTSGADRGLQQIAEGACPNPHWRNRRWEDGKLILPRHTHYWQCEMAHPHRQCGEERLTQRLVNLRKKKKFVLAPKNFTNFYRCTIESILLGYITACNSRALQRVVQSAQRITGGKLPNLQHLMSRESQKDHQGHQPP